MKGVQYLYGTITPDQLDVPTFVINYDTEVRQKSKREIFYCIIYSLLLDAPLTEISF